MVPNRAPPLVSPRRSAAKRLLSMVLPYRKLNGGREKREAEYRSGTWDYLWGIEELARFSVVAGYCHHLRPGASILEIGCGEGILQRRLDPTRYSRYVGVDISAEAVRRAAARDDASANFVCEDAELYEPREIFDVVVFNESLEYFHDPVGLVRRYEPYLAADGVFVVSMFVGSETARTGKIWKRLQSVYRPRDATRVTNMAGQSWVIKVFAPGRELPDDSCGASAV